MRQITWRWSNETAQWVSKNVRPIDKADATLSLSGLEYQKMFGFGACFNELGWRAIGYASTEDRRKLFYELFSEDSLPNFDFSHELEEIFPTVQDALAIESGRIKVMASCWSPPSWMKANGSELGMYNNVRGSLLTSKYQAYKRDIITYAQAERCMERIKNQ